ncbi:MAG TPA: hypothetical protein VF112_08975 [Candidatus Dormibacteraeota bacterium]
MRAPIPVALGVLGALVTGCGDATPAASTSGATPAASTATPAPTTSGPVTVRLRRFPAGLAVVGLNTESKQLSVEIKVAGLAPGSTHPASLVAGGCVRPGAVLHPLQPLVPDKDSVADTTTALPDATDTEIPRSGWALTVSTGSTVIMCGDLDNEAGQSVITAGIGVAPGVPDPKAGGTATLSVVDGALKIAVDVTGLTPGSTHAAQLRRGNCEGERAVLHVLSALTADAGGHAVGTTVIPGIATIPLDGWFLGISPPAGLDPVVCGNVGI